MFNFANEKLIKFIQLEPNCWSTFQNITINQELNEPLKNQKIQIQICSHSWKLEYKQDDMFSLLK